MAFHLEVLAGGDASLVVGHDHLVVGEVGNTEGSRCHVSCCDSANGAVGAVNHGVVRVVGAVVLVVELIDVGAAVGQRGGVLQRHRTQAAYLHNASIASSCGKQHKITVLQIPL